MKRIIMLAMALVMILASIGGCWPWRDEGGRGGGRDRDDGYNRSGGPGGSEAPRGHTGPGGAGGGH